MPRCRETAFEFSDKTKLDTKTHDNVLFFGGLSVVAIATTGEYHALRFVCMYLYVETTSASLRCTAWSASGGVAVEPSMCSAPHLIGLHTHAGAAERHAAWSLSLGF